MWEGQNWRHEVEQAQNTGQFPCLCFVRPDDHDTYMSISGEEGACFPVMLEVVAKSEMLGFLGRDTANASLDGATAAQVSTFIERFYTLDRLALYAWARSFSPV